MLYKLYDGLVLYFLLISIFVKTVAMNTVVPDKNSSEKPRYIAEVNIKDREVHRLNFLKIVKNQILEITSNEKLQVFPLCENFLQRELSPRQFWIGLHEAPG